MLQSLSIARSLSAPSSAKAAAVRRVALTLSLGASIFGSLTATGFAQTRVPSPEKRIVVREEFVSRIILPELSATLATTSLRTATNTPRRVNLVCTVKNAGRLPSGPFVTVVTGQLNTGEMFQRVFPMNLRGGVSQTVVLPAGFVSSGPTLAWAKCSVDDTKVVQESNESNNITDLILRPVGS